MTVIHGVVIDCAAPRTLSPFWRAVLGWEYRMREDDWCSLRNPAGGPHLSFQLVPELMVVKYRVHFDIRPNRQSRRGAGADRRAGRVGASVLRPGRGEPLGDGRPGEKRVLHPQARSPPA